MLRLHVAGDWRQHEVLVRRVASTHRVDLRVQEMIQRAWQVALARPGVHLFDGPMCRHESWRICADGKLELELSATSYRMFVGTNLSNPELADRHGPRVLANPVGVSPALLTRDGYLLLGVRNNRVAYYPDRIHPFAGAVEPNDDLNLFDAVRRELREELSLSAERDVLDIRCTGIVEDLRLRQPEVIFRVTSGLERFEIEQRLDRAEHGASYAIPAQREPVERAMRDPRLTPVAAAALALWGRCEFGQDWFDGCGVFIG